MEVALRNPDMHRFSAVAAVLTAIPRALPWPRSAAGAQSGRPIIIGPVHAVPVVPAAPAGIGNQSAEGLYRILEIAIALIGITVSLPVMAVVALCIRLESPGPALFLHRRTSRSRAIPGRDAQNENGLIAPPGGFQPGQLYYVPTTFHFVKFRTMYSDARERFPELYAYQYEQDEFHRRKFKDEEDPRVTRRGHWLRRLTLDELPNLFCVLAGSMRLVGPRPELPDVLKYYPPEQMYKFSVKPGVTGLAQINGRGNLNWGETISWDMEYVRTRSVALDLKIIILTLWYVIVRRGAF
jgi:lipopolysaccharide/colanic/teichoic acid biosynthesis glycosyltransferase